jgi:hypothetical protein
MDTDSLQVVMGQAGVVVRGQRRQRLLLQWTLVWSKWSLKMWRHGCASNSSRSSGSSSK